MKETWGDGIQKGRKRENREVNGERGETGDDQYSPVPQPDQVK